MMGKYDQSTLVVLITCLATTGCSTGPVSELPRAVSGTEGSVGAELVIAPADAHYQVIPGADFAHGSPNENNAMPVYPAELLTARLPPAQLVVRLVVDEDGTVSEATALENPSGHQAFAVATLAVVREWTFSPLRRIENGQATRVPFTQDYKFTFRQTNGRGSVESDSR